MNHAPSHLDTSSKLVPWDFSKYGGRFKLEEAADGKRFFERWGFVVFTEVMSEEENGAVLEGLVDAAVPQPSERGDELHRDNLVVLHARLNR